MQEHAKQNEKTGLILCGLLLVFVSCKSTDIPNPGNPAGSVRSDLSKIQSEQSDINGTAERLKERINAAESTAAAREELDEEFERILSEIREQRISP